MVRLVLHEKCTGPGYMQNDDGEVMSITTVVYKDGYYTDICLNEQM